MTDTTHYKKRIYIVLGVFFAVTLFFGGLYTGSNSTIMSTLARKVPFLGYHNAQAEITKDVSDVQMSRFWYVWNLLEQKYPFKEIGRAHV